MLQTGYNCIAIRNLSNTVDVCFFSFDLPLQAPLFYTRRGSDRGNPRFKVWKAWSQNDARLQAGNE